MQFRAPRGNKRGKYRKLPGKFNNNITKKLKKTLHGLNSNSNNKWIKKLLDVCSFNWVCLQASYLRILKDSKLPKFLQAPKSTGNQGNFHFSWFWTEIGQIQFLKKLRIQRGYPCFFAVWKKLGKQENSVSHEIDTSIASLVINEARRIYFATSCTIWVLNGLELKL